MRAISLKGIVIGGLSDIIATSAIMLVLTCAYTLIYILVSGHQLSQDAFATAVNGPGALQILSTLGGALGSTIGGYVAARIAQRGELLNGTLSSFLCILLSLASLAYNGTEHSWPVFLTLESIAPLCGLLGGALSKSSAREGALNQASTRLPAAAGLR